MHTTGSAHLGSLDGKARACFSGASSIQIYGAEWGEDQDTTCSLMASFGWARNVSELKIENRETPLDGWPVNPSICTHVLYARGSIRRSWLGLTPTIREKTSSFQQEMPFRLSLEFISISVLIVLTAIVLKLASLSPFI